ncbi:type 4a pilus biogenesis protein PilO [Myxococcota bacterium]|nr:type 4a pilus biogenesis protein PilO [Myxococcota bacterium]MBU1379998.1 type 4a pilus biogenesis protein PilO [Myxococcota bacterium]MBU1496755.1 type 4a pilus biogenesis protein PilO [Myxococcota bacterium]
MQRIYSWLATAPILHRAFLVCAICSGMVAYYYFYPWTASKSKVEDSRKRLNYARISLMEAKRRLTEATKAREELKQMQLKGEELDKRIPGRVDMSELVGELDQMSDDVKIIEIKPMEEDSSSYDSVVIKPINFRVEGRFHSILKFLYKMFKMNRLMDIGDIELQRKAAGQDKEKTNKNYNLICDFTARIYFSPAIPSAVAAKGDKKGPAGGITNMAPPMMPGAMPPMTGGK